MTDQKISTACNSSSPEMTKTVARVSDRVVGFVMLSGTDLVDDAGRRREVLTLTPLAVMPEYECRGIGSTLVRTALDEAERRGETLVFLQGSPRYYGRIGFTLARDHRISIDLPDWARVGAQVYLLSGYEPRIRGRIEYPPPIAAVST
ncbi:MAG: putative acetyltransferase [Pseudonocardiales bacterium]|jgi:putative acetyltransferase|nr:putative acetyltransferase [Pseudonocardiales bacterium]